MATKSRQRLEEFAATIGDGQYKPQKRLIRDMLRGLHVAGDTMLTAISRALREKQDHFYTSTP